MSTSGTEQGNSAGHNRNQRNRDTNEIQIDGVNGLLYLMFRHGSILYVNTFPEPVRRMFEFILLIKAFMALFSLVYIHTVVLNAGAHCLDHVQDDWPRDGILRVEIHPNYYQEKTILEFYEQSQNNVESTDSDNEGLHSLNVNNGQSDDAENITEDSLFFKNPSASKSDSKVYSSDKIVSKKAFKKQESKEMDTDMFLDDKDMLNTSHPSEKGGVADSDPELDDELFDIPDNYLDSESNDKLENHEVNLQGLEMLSDDAYYSENYYIMEYSLEFALLKLQKKTRERLKIPVLTVKLDPDVDKCFSDSFSRFLLREFFGYKDFLVHTLKSISIKVDNRGFIKDVLTGKVYRFVPPCIAKATYIVALFFMVVFTLTMSILMRYTYLQFYMFVLSFINYIEFNGRMTYPLAPLLTVVFAIVGMHEWKAIMTEFFSDPETALYLMFIVYLADFFDAVCCRFFFLYHYAFYAYHFRYRTEYSYLALITSWLFICVNNNFATHSREVNGLVFAPTTLNRIKHSMLYFFHHFELPEILASEGTENFDNPLDIFDDQVQVNSVNNDHELSSDESGPNLSTSSSSAETVAATIDVSISATESGSQTNNNNLTLSRHANATPSNNVASNSDDFTKFFRS
ncbi:Membralin [Nymphon striatum]|nr:Membralin [Nymphon striatum]